MQRTTPGLRTDPAARLADLERQRPEWRAWLRLLGQARRALDDPGWTTLFAEAESAGGDAGASAQAPLLHGRNLEVDAARVRRLVRRLASTAVGEEAAGAGSLRGYRPSTVEAVGLLGAAVRQDLAGIGAFAAAGGVDPAALASVADLAALPLMQSCGRLLAHLVPRFWTQGYCPICASWPTLAERRGLDRSRRLRCGRCGGDWPVNWLCCIYCGEKEHERLGSLMPEGRGETLTVETCASCRGYLKSVATLQQIPPLTLLLQDLETVELDLVALDRGYSRPQGGGFVLDVRVTARPSRPIWRALGDG
jgi:FdhE protein